MWPDHDLWLRLSSSLWNSQLCWWIGFGKLFPKKYSLFFSIIFKISAHYSHKINLLFPNVLTIYKKVHIKQWKQRVMITISVTFILVGLYRAQNYEQVDCWPSTNVQALIPKPIFPRVVFIVNSIYTYVYHSTYNSWFLKNVLFSFIKLIYCLYYSQIILRIICQSLLVEMPGILL